jgi:hypothetical protein
MVRDVVSAVAAAIAYAKFIAKLDFPEFTGPCNQIDFRRCL